RRRQRTYNSKQDLSKSRWFYRFQKVLMVGLIVILTFYLLRFTVFLYGNPERQTRKKLKEVATLLNHEKKTVGHYPENLSVLDRNNPLLKDVHKDYWGQEFFYERHPSG